MKYCVDCWEKFDGKNYCPECGAKLYDCDDFDSFEVHGGLLTACYRSKIPYGVRACGSRCVGYGAHLTELILPSSVKYIADRAFASNSDIQRMTIPSSVTHVGYEAFYCCYSLTSIDLPGIRRIGKSAFSQCSALAKVTIGSSVVSIGEYAFSNCYKLGTIKFTGTRAQWAAVKKGNSWKSGVSAKAVICSDGKVVL